MKKILTFFSLIMTVMFVIFRVVILNYYSTKGVEYELLNLKLKSLEIENSLLSQRIASSSSIISLSQKAKLLGFKSDTEIVSLYGPQPLAAVANTL